MPSTRNKTASPRQERLEARESGKYSKLMKGPNSGRNTMTFKPSKEPINYESNPKNNNSFNIDNPPNILKHTAMRNVAPNLEEDNQSKSNSNSDDSSVETQDNGMDEDFRRQNDGNDEDEDLVEEALEDDDIELINRKQQTHQSTDLLNRGSLINKKIAMRHKKRLSSGSHDSSLSSRSHISTAISETQTERDTNKLQSHMLSKKTECYKNLNDNEILTIGWYVRDDLFRRVKMISESMMKPIIEAVLTKLQMNESEGHRKYSDLKACIKTHLNYRRAYVTKKIRSLLRGKTMNCTYFLGLSVLSNSYDQFLFH